MQSHDMTFIQILAVVGAIIAVYTAGFATAVTEPTKHNKSLLKFLFIVLVILGIFLFGSLF